MSVASGFEIEQAIAARLQADSTLAQLAPGGIWTEGEAPEGVQGIYVTLQLQIESVRYEQGGIGHRIARVQVKAIGRTTSSAPVKTAAARILALLEGASFSVEGHTLMICKLAEDNARFAYSERDGSYLWRHAGYDFEVWAAPR